MGGSVPAAKHVLGLEEKEMRLSKEQSDTEQRIGAVHQIIFDIRKDKKAMKEIRKWLKEVKNGR